MAVRHDDRIGHLSGEPICASRLRRPDEPQSLVRIEAYVDERKGLRFPTEGKNSVMSMIKMVRKPTNYSFPGPLVHNYQMLKKTFHHGRLMP